MDSTFDPQSAPRQEKNQMKFGILPFCRDIMSCLRLTQENCLQSCTLNDYMPHMINLGNTPAVVTQKWIEEIYVLLWAEFFVMQTVSEQRNSTERGTRRSPVCL